MSDMPSHEEQSIALHQQLARLMLLAAAQPQQLGYITSALSRINGGCAFSTTGPVEVARLKAEYLECAWPGDAEVSAEVLRSPGATGYSFGGKKPIDLIKGLKRCGVDVNLIQTSSRVELMDFPPTSGGASYHPATPSEFWSQYYLLLRAGSYQQQRALCSLNGGEIVPVSDLLDHLLDCCVRNLLEEPLAKEPLDELIDAGSPCVARIRCQERNENAQAVLTIDDGAHATLELVKSGVGKPCGTYCLYRSRSFHVSPETLESDPGDIWAVE